MVTTVIFDLDDTLVNTSDILDEALSVTFLNHLKYFPNRTVEELLELNYQILDRLLSDPTIPVPTVTSLLWIKIFEYLKIQPKLRPVISLLNQSREEILKRTEAKDGARELLEYLKENRIRVGVLTNGSFIEQGNKLLKVHLSRYVDSLVTPDICLVNKPDGKAFRFILKELQSKPEDTIMVGDDFKADILGAKRAGIQTVLINSRYKDYTPNQEKEADYFLEDLSQVKDVFSEILT